VCSSDLYAYCRTFLMQQPCQYQSISAVITWSAKDFKYSTLPVGMCTYPFKNRSAGSFHELIHRYLLVGNSAVLHAAYLFRTKYFHLSMFYMQIDKIIFI